MGASTLGGVRAGFERVCAKVGARHACALLSNLCGVRRPYERLFSGWSKAAPISSFFVQSPGGRCHHLTGAPYPRSCASVCLCVRPVRMRLFVWFRAMAAARLVCLEFPSSPPSSRAFRCLATVGGGTVIDLRCFIACDSPRPVNHTPSPSWCIRPKQGCI